jgi:hypothetical protein
MCGRKLALCEWSLVVWLGERVRAGRLLHREAGRTCYGQPQTLGLDFWAHWWVLNLW